MTEDEKVLEGIKANYPTTDDKLAMLLVITDKIEQNTQKLKTISGIMVFTLIMGILAALVSLLT